jgi:hypothetical protein
MRSDIARMLKQRGYQVTKESTERDILLPRQMDEDIADSLEVILYNLMRRDSIRRALRDWAYGSPNESNVHYIESYIEICSRFGELNVGSPHAKQALYAHTFEWYVSQLLSREFAARASGFGLRLKDGSPDDEFDCVAVLDGGVVFIECKTGKGDIYPEISKFIRRDAELNAAYSVFVFDRDYTFSREGDDLPEISPAEAKKLGVRAIYRISVGPHVFFQILGTPNAQGMHRFFFACPAFDGFEERIRYMIRYCNEAREYGAYGVYPDWCETKLIVIAEPTPGQVTLVHPLRQGLVLPPGRSIGT